MNFEKSVSEIRDDFLEICQNKIHREGVEKLMDWIANSDFFVAPASTRYHGSFEGGLVIHSLNTYRCLIDELESSGLSDVYTDETVAIVSLFHDICKTNFYKKGTRNVKENGQWVTKDVFEIDEKFPCGHGEKSVIILQNFIRLTVDEIFAIRAHMGGFDTSVKGGDYFIGKIFERSKLALLLHIADMKATYLMEG